MLRKRRSKQYNVPLCELREEQLLQQILFTLERMEDLLEQILAKQPGNDDDNGGGNGPPHHDDEDTAEMLAAWVNRNTAALSSISLVDPDLKSLPRRPTG